MTLTLDATVAVADRRGPNEQPARFVAPGLAITPSLATAGRYVLTHVDSGLCVPAGQFCEDHIAQAAAMAAASGIDWTVPAAEVDQPAGKRLRDEIAAAIRSCWTCPNGVTDPEPAGDVPDVRIVAGTQFTVAFRGAEQVAVKWEAGGLWYVADGGGAPLTFAKERPATEAFLAAAGVPA